MAADLAVALSLECGVQPIIAEYIGKAMVLHDIGKCKIPDSIKNKQGKLSPSEYEIMKTHTTHGADMLSGIRGEFGEIARNISLYHHEQYNGEGYWRRRTNDLPNYIQISSICDVYCALIYKRVYKQAWPVNEALGYIKDRAGEKFCPKLVKVFLSLMSRQNFTADEGSCAI